MTDTDKKIYDKAVNRAVIAAGIDKNYQSEIIVFLEKEIDRYRDKIEYLKTRNESLHERLINIQGDLNAALDRTVTLEAVQDVTTDDLINAISKAGYNFSINFFKDNESEES